LICSEFCGLHLLASAWYQDLSKVIQVAGTGSKGAYAWHALLATSTTSIAMPFLGRLNGFSRRIWSLRGRFRLAVAIP